MIDPTLDGVTHVNIYSQGKTELGRMLSNFFKYSIQTEDGSFNSVEGYWYWLGIADCEQKDRMRGFHGFFAKKIGNELKKNFGTRVDEDFENKILRAIWYKVKRHEHLFTSEVSRLPFEHYYNYGGKVVDVKDKYLWMMNGIDRLRNHIIGKK